MDQFTIISFLFPLSHGAIEIVRYLVRGNRNKIDSFQRSRTTIERDGKQAQGVKIHLIRLIKGYATMEASNLRHFAFLLISTFSSSLPPQSIHVSRDYSRRVPSVSTPYKRCMSRAFTPFTPSVTELPHLAIFIHPTRTTPVFNSFLPSPAPSLSLVYHCASRCFFPPFLLFLVEITKCGKRQQLIKV